MTFENNDENAKSQVVKGYFVAVPPDHLESNIDYLNYIRVIKYYKKYTIASILIFLFLGVSLSLLMTKIYQVEVLTSPVSEDSAKGGLSGIASQFGGLASIAGISVGSESGKKEEALAILQSRNFIEKFILDEKILPVLFSNKWDIHKSEWTVEKNEVPTTYDGYLIFIKNIMKISEDKNTGFISISIEWKDEKLVTIWANRIVEKLNQHMKSKEIDEARKSIQFLKNELSKADIIHMQKALHSLMESQLQKIMFANIRDDNVLKVIVPATSPREDEFIKPRRLLIMGIFLMFGLISGIIISFYKNYKDKIYITN